MKSSEEEKKFYFHKPSRSLILHKAETVCICKNPISPSINISIRTSIITSISISIRISISTSFVFLFSSLSTCNMYYYF